MGSQPIRIQLGKMLWKNVGKCRKSLREILGKSCGKFLSETLVGKMLLQGKFLQENLVGKSCRKFLREILVGQGGEKANLRKTVIGGNLAFGIG